MTQQVELLLFLTGVIGLFAVISARFRIPSPILLVIVGIVLAIVPGVPRIKLDPEWIFVLILPPLLYAESIRFPWREFVTNVRLIILLATGLVIATTFVVAFSLYAIIPGLTLAGAFVLGAIVSSPDAGAATEILKNMRVPDRMMNILRGEGLINDSTALVIYQMALAVLMATNYTWQRGVFDFFSSSIGGIAIGLAIGFIITKIVNQISDPVVEVTVSLMAPYLAYLPAYELGLSGVLATVSAGLYIGHRLDRILAPEARLIRREVWEFIGFFLNGFVFILIGLQFPDIMSYLHGFSAWQLVLWSLVLAVVVILMRLVWMFSVGFIMGRKLLPKILQEPLLPNRELVLLSWCGMRGVVALAAALAIPVFATTEQNTERSLTLFLTASLIVSTLIFQGLSLPFLIRLLKLKSLFDEREKEKEARIKLLADALEHMDELAIESNSENAPAICMMRENYLVLLNHIREGKLMNCSAEDCEASLRFISKVVCHQRYYLRMMREQGEITSDIHSRIEYDLDLTEERFRRLINTEERLVETPKD